MTKSLPSEKFTKKEEGIINEMIEAGVYFGHTKSRKNPKMSRKNPKMTPYIYALKNNIYIIDLISSLKKLNEALDFIEGIVKKKGVVLFVGTLPQCLMSLRDGLEEL